MSAPIPSRLPSSVLPATPEVIPFPRTRREAHVQELARFLRLESERLRMRHRAGLSGPEVLFGRTDQVDQVVMRVCRLAASEAAAAECDLERVAVAAYGSYARHELAPHSAVDLLFLHDGRPPESVRQFADETVGFLRDAGLVIHHRFTSPGELLGKAMEQFPDRAAAGEAHFLTGSAALFDDLREELDATSPRDEGELAVFAAAVREAIASRHARFGGAVAVQEPDVRDGVGGLRDLHSILWVSRTLHGSRSLAELLTSGRITSAENLTARRAFEFLTRVRAELHFMAGTKQDVLALDLQGEVAANLGYDAGGGLLASERFMRDYYRRASELAEVSRGFLRRHLEGPSSSTAPRFSPRRLSRSLEVRDGSLSLGGDGLEGPMALLDVFTAVQEERIPVSEELRTAERESLSLIDHAFRSSPEAREAFLRILSRRGRVGPALRAMHETGFLGRYLPEWDRVAFLVHHDFVHRYTVDEQTLRAIEALDAVFSGRDPEAAPFGRILDGVGDATPVTLALLLHDLGKGRGGPPSAATRIAARVAERLGLDPALTADVLFLVGNHDEMSAVATRRDLSEPLPIASFASRVGTLERLDMLLLLTQCVQSSVLPSASSRARRSALLELHARARAHLSGTLSGAEEGGEAKSAAARAFEKLRHHFPAPDLERHFALLPDRYLKTTDASRMVRHYRLLARRGQAPAALEWRDLPGGNGSELTVVAEDRPGLFAKIAGTLTASGIQIQAVRLFARDDGVVLDTLRVAEPTSPHPVTAARRATVASVLLDVLSGLRDVDDEVRRWRADFAAQAPRAWGRVEREPSVRCDNDASAVATVVDVRAPDRAGLAFTIARALSGLRLDITFGRLATDHARAVDVFYVTEGGRKLATEALPKLEDALLDALRDTAPARPRPAK